MCGSANGRQVAPESALYVADMAKKLQKFSETGSGSLCVTLNNIYLPLYLMNDVIFYICEEIK